MLFEPGSGEAFDIDESLIELFNVDLVDDPDTYLAADLYKDWYDQGGRPPEVGQCVGFKVPLFLGGKGSTENLELTDLAVYWTFAAQLRTATELQPTGTMITGVDSAD
jgi:hypothetical protein